MNYNIVLTPSSEEKYEISVRKQCSCPHGNELVNLGRLWRCVKNKKVVADFQAAFPYLESIPKQNKYIVKD